MSFLLWTRDRQDVSVCQEAVKQLTRTASSESVRTRQSAHILLALSASSHSMASLRSGLGSIGVAAGRACIVSIGRRERRERATRPDTNSASDDTAHDAHERKKQEAGETDTSKNQGSRVIPNAVW